MSELPMKKSDRQGFNINAQAGGTTFLQITENEINGT
jgi:hypothetical protein